MVVKLMKSEDTFSFHLDGNSYIDAVVLSKIIMDLAELTKIAALEENPEAYLKMNVTAFKNGSFEIGFSAICEFTENLISQGSQFIQLASTAISTVKGFFEIKKLLKGKKPKSIQENNDGKITVTSEDNHSVTVNKSSGAVVSNIHIDSLVVNISTNVNENNSTGGFSFESNNESVYFNNDDIEQMSKPLPIMEEEIIKTSVIRVDLPIKRAALIGRGAWSFIYNNKTIEARMEDEDFLEQMHRGEISIHSGDFITAELAISVPIKEDNSLDESAIKYSIRKVDGGIKNNKNYIKPII